MIPIKLQIKNFLSYGSESQTIDFTPYQLICLSGKNGHGKSALLDAITWALWGQARKISGVTKADDGLLKIGQSNMMVSLDFECNNQQYRVKREYGKTSNKPYATLDFGIYDKNGKLISLSENRIRKTQEKIDNTLSLSLDTFVNSAFLRQGQANEFSKKSPKDRKDIFAQILGLQQYESIRKLASDKAKQAITEKESILKFQEKIMLELQKRDEIIKQITHITDQLAEIAQQETTITKTQKELTHTKNKLLEDQKNYQILQFRFNELIKKEQEGQVKLIQVRNKWRQIHRQSLKKNNPEELKKEKSSLVQEVHKHQKMLEKKLELKEQYLKHKERLHLIEKDFYESFQKEVQDKKLKLERLNLTLTNSNANFKELLQKQFDINLQKKLYQDECKKLQDATTLNTINKKELENEEKLFEKRKEFYQKYIAQGNLLTRELEALEQKKLLSQDEQSPCCPLCEQNLSASRKKFLQNKFAKQEQSYKHKLSRLSDIIPALKQKLIVQNDLLKKLKTTEEKNKINEIKIHELQKTLVQLDKETQNTNTTIKNSKDAQKQFSKDIENAENTLKKIMLQEKENLEATSEYKKIKIQLNSIETEGKALQYNAHIHKQVSEKLKEIETQLTAYEQIQQEIAQQKERTLQISEFCWQLKNIKKEKISLQSELLKYKALEQNRQDIDTKEHSILQKIQVLTKQKETLLQNKGSFENQITKLKQLELEHKKQQTCINKLDRETEDYKIIAGATGKDGIQAFLIENAIPEVEQEANNILSRLTNNQAQVFIESLRDLKKGGTKETLDIKISDAAGIRQYELFSGGEAFRIDFALRIAISKLLARRAGTALQTLIIDEGFGSQDEEGLSKIMDAIYKIQEDFSKVIIVSHLHSMKDQFPVHFFVRKGPNGSTISVIEQG